LFVINAAQVPFLDGASGSCRRCSSPSEQVLYLVNKRNVRDASLVGVARYGVTNQRKGGGAKRELVLRKLNSRGWACIELANC